MTSLYTMALEVPLSVTSPDGTLQVNVKLTDKIYYNLVVDGTQVMWFSPVSLNTAEGGGPVKIRVLMKSSLRSKDGTIQTVLGNPQGNTGKIQ